MGGHTINNVYGTPKAHHSFTQIDSEANLYQKEEANPLYSTTHPL